jgi:glycosyltransferase involved in cell wall biosynthesis
MSCVTVAIPTIPTEERRYMLERALMSVWMQTHPIADVAIAVDIERRGAWATRQRVLDRVTTPWVAFLDDDDEFMPQHIERLLACAAETHADYVFPWFEPIGGSDPMRHLGKPFDPKHPHDTTTTILVRTELARRVGFTPPAELARGGGEDWRFTLGCIAAGAKIVHLPERTWYYHGDRKGTLGMPFRWMPDRRWKVPKED